MTIETLMIVIITLVILFAILGWGFWFSFINDPAQKELARRRKEYKKSFAHLEGF